MWRHTHEALMFSPRDPPMPKEAHLKVVEGLSHCPHLTSQRKPPLEVSFLLNGHSEALI